MSKLTKEEVISTLQDALSKKENKAVTIEQKGSWYKIDGGKSIRFSELETMLEEFGAAPQVEAKAETKPVAKKAPAKKSPAKKTADKAPTSNVGMTPKQLWRNKLAAQSGKSTLPRGF
ncbi:hypothetical protein [Shewanella gelidii]|uniref:Uncharacterized protein n=1 Tax=Shewanella gelidii TaxID=1642821 RepID=A0A917JYV9_9GAMM|nr:hypothetical protein [Shewanella gelidii]MCL1099014.1 hypothetical protein [Shewanella gelidii]GGI88856.1 hypothetical protein GCM10009332_27820 [Shewanella gelidii]